MRACIYLFMQNAGSLVFFKTHNATVSVTLGNCYSKNVQVSYNFMQIIICAGTKPRLCKLNNNKQTAPSRKTGLFSSLCIIKGTATKKHFLFSHSHTPTDAHVCIHMRTHTHTHVCPHQHVQTMNHAHTYDANTVACTHQSYLDTTLVSNWILTSCQSEWHRVTSAWSDMAKSQDTFYSAFHMYSYTQVKHTNSV